MCVFTDITPSNACNTAMIMGGIRVEHRLSLFIAAAFLFCPFASPALEPAPQDSTLQIGNRTLRPVEVTKSWRTSHVVGTNRFYVVGDEVQRRTAEGTNLVWRATTD